MRTQKIILQSFILFGLLTAASSCALFKKNCDCPKFNQQLYEQASPGFAVDYSPMKDSSQIYQLQNIE
ncbi:MAG: hypothetical protein HKO56_00325 [Bacteroidia bacterium]|nr:hypothetical protein [Bacteroidia bacterium]